MILRTAIYRLIRVRQSTGSNVVWTHIRGAVGGFNPSRRYSAVNMARLLLGGDGVGWGGVFCIGTSKGNADPLTGSVFVYSTQA